MWRTTLTQNPPKSFFASGDPIKGEDANKGLDGRNHSDFDELLGISYPFRANNMPDDMLVSIKTREKRVRSLNREHFRTVTHVTGTIRLHVQGAKQGKNLIESEARELRRRRWNREHE